MADDEDQSSKTEEPSDRKLGKLREEGNIPKSKEVGNFAMLFAMLLVVAFAMPWQMERLLTLMGTTMQVAATTPLNSVEFVASPMKAMTKEAFVAMSPVFALLALFAWFGGFGQSGPIFSFKPIQPKLSKISLLQGFKRLFSAKSIAEFLKSIFKLVVIGFAIWGIFYMHDDELILMIDKSLFGILLTTHTIAIRMILAALAIMVIIAVTDFLFQKAQYTKEHRMSRKEMKDEMKDTNGDPFIKQRQRQLQRQRAMMRMMQEVPKADVVVTNPTHYAVALSYKPDDGMAAPQVVAKGADWMAARIREIAQENDVPLYEDPPLARRLYADVEIGDEIPLTLYEVTAKVIAYISQLKKKRA